MPLRIRPTLPFLRLLMESVVGAGATLSSNLRLFAITNAAGKIDLMFTVSVGSVAIIASQLGISSAFTITAALYALIASRLGISNAPLELHDADDLVDVWVVNTDTSASTRYEQFTFNSYAVVDGTCYGARDDGIYRLEGDDDAGQPIRASINFGKQNFGGTTLKRVPTAYIGTTSSGVLVMKVIAEDETYLYTARDASEHLQTQRFDFGKGLRANFFEFELYNGAGEDFDLASVEFVPVALSRRI
jgi:hypothetical protein